MNRLILYRSTVYWTSGDSNVTWLQVRSPDWHLHDMCLLTCYDNYTAYIIIIILYLLSYLNWLCSCKGSLTHSLTSVMRYFLMSDPYTIFTWTEALDLKLSESMQNLNNFRPFLRWLLLKISFVFINWINTEAVFSIIPSLYFGL